MNDFLNRLNYPVITGRPEPGVHPGNAPAPMQPGKTFREMLDQSLTGADGLTFSRHAQARVDQRGVIISPAELRQLEQAVGRASEKGITDSLVYLDGTAYIINIPNRVVVTVVDGTDSEQAVFTNIDGAVIV